MQGGILSPTLFNLYTRDLLTQLASSQIGCDIGGLFVNVLAYADDMVLLAPCWKAPQQLLTVFAQHIASIDMICNVKKMIFEPRDHSKIMSFAFPQFSLDGIFKLSNI